MHNHHWLLELLKNSLSWAFVWLGHAVGSVTLSGVALITSIIYSAVNVWVILERRHQQKKEQRNATDHS